MKFLWGVLSLVVPLSCVADDTRVLQHVPAKGDPCHQAYTKTTENPHNFYKCLAHEVDWCDKEATNFLTLHPKSDPKEKLPHIMIGLGGNGIPILNKDKILLPQSDVEIINEMITCAGGTDGSGGNILNSVKYKVRNCNGGHSLVTVAKGDWERVDIGSDPVSSIMKPTSSLEPKNYHSSCSIGNRKLREEGACIEGKVYIVLPPLFEKLVKDCRQKYLG